LIRVKERGSGRGHRIMKRKTVEQKFEEVFR